MSNFSLFYVFGSHMILQREKPINVWGYGTSGSHISVTFCGITLDTVCEDNKWMVTFPTQPAGRNHTLTATSDLKEDTDIVLEDISIGDIWLAGGQSNMEFFLRYDKDWDQVKQEPVNPDIHVFNVPQVAYPGHKRSIPGYGRWMTSDDPEFDTFSAPGFSFAKTVQPTLGIPVGIIGCNWGGTTATSWMDEKWLEEEPLNIYLKEYEDACSLYSVEDMKNISLKAWEFEDSAKHSEDFMPLLYGRDWDWQLNYLKEHKDDPVIPMGPYHINRPGGLYHLMLEPLIPFSFKGAIWYQGETDAGHGEIYDKLLTKMITSWRELWKDEFPFLLVQLAPFSVWLECDAKNYTIVRECQHRVSKTVPNTAMASIMDIGSFYDIHPKEKMEVGRRLGLLALGKVYEEDIVCESPEIDTYKVKDDQVILSFSYAADLRITGERNDFTLVQNDKELEISDIKAAGNEVILTVNGLVDDPAVLSLGWADYAEIHIHNEAGLPIKPFTLELMR